MHIQESFLGFTEVESHKGQDLAFLITKETESVTDLQKIRGKGHDGAANMSGAYEGLQTLMKQKALRARHIHCSAHALNFVMFSLVLLADGIVYRKIADFSAFCHCNRKIERN